MNENPVDAKSTAKAVTSSDHHNEKEVSSVNTSEPVAVTQSGNSIQEEPNVHKKVC